MFTSTSTIEKKEKKVQIFTRFKVKIRFIQFNLEKKNYIHNIIITSSSIQ